MTCLFNEQKCTYCSSFYSSIDVSNSNRKSLTSIKLRRSEELAKNVTQENYFLDFNGKVTDLSKEKLVHLKISKQNTFNLQEKCQKHLKKLRYMKKSKSKTVKINDSQKLNKKVNFKS
jgi:hypothetical protein